MTTAAHVLAVILAVICLVGAIGDFMVLPRIVATMDRLEISRRIIPFAGVAKLGGAIGLLLGFGVEWLGVAAALALGVYFTIATAAHLRVRDSIADTAPAAVLLLLSVATFVVSV